MSGRVDVSVIIVSYNTRELTLQCLRSLYEDVRGLEMEVLVVENASSDGSASAIQAEFPQATLVTLGENIGFARANNLAAKQAAGELLLLLNPDTIVRGGAVQNLVEFARSRPGAGIWGGRTLFPDGSLNPTSCWARPTLWSALCYGVGLSSLFRGSAVFDRESMGGWARDSERGVDIVTGCFLLIERALWRELGGFDPAFFMYAEEADLCLRAASLGRRPMFTPQATIVHYGGASERVRADKMVRLFYAKALLMRKHWRPAAARFGVFTLDLWALTRVAGLRVLTLFRPSLKESYSTWRTVLGRRAEWRPWKAAIAPVGMNAAC